MAPRPSRPWNTLCWPARRACKRCASRPRPGHGLLDTGPRRAGCIRLTNDDVVDLYEQVKVGTKVIVLPPNAARRPSQAAPPDAASRSPDRARRRAGHRQPTRKCRHPNRRSPRRGSSRSPAQSPDLMCHAFVNSTGHPSATAYLCRARESLAAGDGQPRSGRLLRPGLVLHRLRLPRMGGLRVRRQDIWRDFLGSC